MTSVSEQIIKKYCSSVEDRIAACCNKQVATYLKQSICDEVKKKCNSEIVFNFVKQYLENLIQVRFQSNRK